LGSKAAATETTSEKSGPREDIMSVLMAYEKKGGTLGKPIIPGNESDSEDDDPDEIKVPDFGKPGPSMMEIDDADGNGERDLHIKLYHFA